MTTEPMQTGKQLAVRETPIPGFLVFDLPVHGDNRGWFKENWQREKQLALGLPDFGPAFEVTCDKHGGSGLGKVQQWDASAKTWSVITDWIKSDDSVIQPLIMEDSAAYAAENNIAERCN